MARILRSTYINIQNISDGAGNICVNNNTLGQRANRVEDKEPACEQASRKSVDNDINKMADLCTCAFLAEDTMYK